MSTDSPDHGRHPVRAALASATDWSRLVAECPAREPAIIDFPVSHAASERILTAELRSEWLRSNA